MAHRPNDAPAPATGTSGQGPVLVIHPPVSLARDFIDYPYFSDLGAVQLAAVLRAHVPVRLVDSFALATSGLRWREDGRALLGAEVEEVLEAVWRPGPATAAQLIVVAYTPFHRPPHRDDVLGALLAGLRRDTAAPIVLADCYQSGQHYVDAAGEAILAAYPEADALVKYEAEETLPALVERFLGRGERPAGVHFGAAPASLDALPLPAWDLVDLEAHDAFRARVVRHLGRGAWAFPINGRTLPLVTSRGCPFTCVHCSSNPGRPAGAPKTQRRYSPERLRELLRATVLTHGATRLEVLDELVNVNERHFDHFLDEVDRLGVAFDVPNGMRADYLEPRHLARMKGRITTLSVSAESGVQRVVTEVVGKRLDLGAIVRAAENASAAGVPLLIHFIIGLPGETAPEINATLAFALDLFERFGAQPAVQFATPLPGTELARGRVLPVVSDWGPSFQSAPSQPGAAVSPEVLAGFKRAFEHRLRSARAPHTVVLNLTHACNNDCSFCAVGPRTQLRSLASGVRETLLEHRRRGSDAVEFDGGEPTLHPELVPLAQYARRLGFERITVTTNGRLCFYPQFAERLVRSGVTTLLFSVHGPDAASHAAHVGVAEAFEQTVAGIRHCVSRAPEGVELGMAVTVTRHNVDRLDDLARLAEGLGLRRLVLQFLTPFGGGAAALAADLTAGATAAMRLIDQWGSHLSISLRHLPYCVIPGYEPHVEGDLLERPASRVVVGLPGVDLPRYLAERRVRRPVCNACPSAITCDGFYEVEQAPEPHWVRAPETDTTRTRTG